MSTSLSSESVPAASPGEPLIQATSLAKAFGENRVLKDVSFEVPRGSVTVVIGPSGSGKTTLLRSLNALELPDSGTVRLDDVSVDFSTIRPGRRGRLPRAERDLLRRYRGRSGMVFQSHNLFPHRTALENVTEGPVVVQGVGAQEARERGRTLLAKVGLAEQADRYPFQLSGGQQQRVGIARALALQPAVVLFDEPTSALDPELVGDVLAVMKDLAAEGLTMVVVTHEFTFARQVADQVLFLDDGQILEHGSPAQVIGDPENPRTRTFLTRVLDPL